MDAHPPLPPEIWEHTPPAAQELIVAQAAMVAQLRAEMAQLRATVEELARRLGRTARTSSQPPSADPPHAVSKRPRREPSGRQPGGQPGPEDQTRALLPVEAVDVLIPLLPVPCRYCQHSLGGEDPPPQRHQVTDIPPIKPVVTVYQRHRLVCPACGAATRAARAALPRGVPTGACGPRVQAMTVLCTGAYHLSKRATQRAMDDLFGLSMSVGTMANLEQATMEAVAAPVAEGRAYVQAQPAADVDETGWREGRQCAWLWMAVPSWVAVLVVRRSRRAAVAQELLGRIAGDGW